MTEQEANEKCDLIRQIAYQLHVYLGVGYLEMGFLQFWLRKIPMQKNSKDKVIKYPMRSLRPLRLKL